MFGRRPIANCNAPIGRDHFDEAAIALRCAIQIRVVFACQPSKRRPHLVPGGGPEVEAAQVIDDGRFSWHVLVVLFPRDATGPCAWSWLTDGAQLSVLGVTSL